MDFEKQRARNGYEWHLAPQVAYFAMTLVFWREGLEALDVFTHEQKRKMHQALGSENGEVTAIRVSSIHHRLNYLYDERDSLQSICKVLESLYNFWRDMAEEEGRGEMSDAGVSAVEYLRLLWREFDLQLRSRGELLNWLGNLQSLSSKRDNTAMKTIVVVTSVFLPATFKAIWLYFAVAIPVSMLILGGMAYWLRRAGVWKKKPADEENPGSSPGITTEAKGKLKLW
ncbi:hypothetical protein B0H66DRAFT_526112 [Apodospora peruviana]|uniref:Uncharacterized protein n=1 Tax=Apodospora peruviana TaxID=516989 RepID=A0AAE0MEF2_9PEZI|nr:hypothetical protein B0H66DRAFT_526112 [Apodospora peruviana]